MENQKLGVLGYCNRQGAAPIRFIQDTANGKILKNRELGRLLAAAEPGDLLITSGIPGSRDRIASFGIVAGCHRARGAPSHIAKSRLLLNDSLPAI